MRADHAATTATATGRRGGQPGSGRKTMPVRGLGWK
jgi:hypothetical protein